MSFEPRFRKKLSDYPGMVNWYSPRVLIRSGILSVVSKTFGHFADRRVTQYLADRVAGHGSGETDEDLIHRHDYSEEAHDGQPFWVDYVADLGDGFDSTYSIAYLLAQPALYGTVHPERAQAVGVAPVKGLRTGAKLERGRLLLMGGDQVYPVPGPEGKHYIDRMITPYSLALPQAANPPHVFAIPGNHDWYDGLQSFDRIFCSKREGDPEMAAQSIGGWETQQHRSYFAIRLPYNWWIWGADIQLGSTLDTAQLSYFHKIGRSLSDDDKIVILTAQHKWYAANQQGEVTALEQLEDIMRPAVERGAHLRAVIAGDSHHYSRYFSEATDFHMLTSGGGGAFLHPTSHLRDKIKIGWRGRIHEFSIRSKIKPASRKAEPEAFDPKTKTTRAIACYPSKARSQWLILRNWLFSLWNWGFALAIGAVYWVMTWFVSETHVADKIAPVNGVVFGSAADYLEYAFLDYFDNDGSLLELFLRSIEGFFAGVVNSPAVSAVALGVWFFLIWFADFRSWISKITVGTVHFFLHVVAMMMIYAFVIYFLAGEKELDEISRTYLGVPYTPTEGWNTFVDHLWFLRWLWDANPIVKAFAFPVFMIPIGALIGGTLFGGYLWFCYRWLQRHWNETFSALAVDDYKNFLRMKFEPERLTIYPIGLDKVGRRRRLRNFLRRVKWRFSSRETGSRVVPAKPLRPHLIEGPIVIGHKLPKSYQRQLGETPDRYKPGPEMAEDSGHTPLPVAEAAAAAISAGAAVAAAKLRPAKGAEGTEGAEGAEKGAEIITADKRPGQSANPPTQSEGGRAQAEPPAGSASISAVALSSDRSATTSPRTVHDRLARPVTAMRPHYDVVVVGSGYGGGIAAARLAQAGKSVCVLERGREFLPGEFPDRLTAAAKQVQISRGGAHYGNPSGLFDFRINEDLNVVVGCGLGGTSLINANVSIIPDERIFADPVWPRELAGDPRLKLAFERAKTMLAPVPTPQEITPHKLTAFAAAAAAEGARCHRAEINVSFKDWVNAAGVAQPGCTLCGDCVTGCNVGAKNTVNLTYLPLAVSHGAEIFTECRVQFVTPANEGRWQVTFQTRNLDSPSSSGESAEAMVTKTVTADTVVLAAGTLGSTEILLRSRAKGLAVSDQLGKGLSGNGDVMAFGYNNDVLINGIGVGVPPRVDVDPVGPCISGLIDLRDGPLTEAMIIEEGTLPSALGPLLPTLFAGGSLFFGDDQDFGWQDELSETGRALESLIMGAYSGAVAHTQTYLAMANDDAGGEMVLEDGQLQIRWPGVARQAIFAKIDEKLAAFTKANGGTYIKNPLSRTIFGENLVTVHPLGGCRMAASADEGVVNHACQVFDVSPGAEPGAVHHGLYVCDGAVIPRSLGVNPLLTISAVAERAMMIINEAASASVAHNQDDETTAGV